MRLLTVEHAARALTEMLGELFDPTETAVAAFEADDGRTWLLEAYFTDAPDEDGMRELVRPLVGDAADAATFETLDAKDWVRASLEGLKPVRSGRFLIHGAHDRVNVRVNDCAIEIEAALAFGTGHHGTTRGCLDMLVRRLKRGRPASVLDVGTGTGVLAFAAARALRHRVVAGDIDPVAIEVARGNARLNGLSPWLRLYVAPGVEHPLARRSRAFDLVFANILARPLRKLAPSLARTVRSGGELVLSGLLPGDVAGVRSAYAAQGFALVSVTILDGWAALVLRRGGAAARPKL
jgi:ribosomal protein L11 methyltransferase